MNDPPVIAENMMLSTFFHCHVNLLSTFRQDYANMSPRYIQDTARISVPKVIFILDQDEKSDNFHQLRLTASWTKVGSILTPSWTIVGCMLVNYAKLVES